MLFELLVALDQCASTLALFLVWETILLIYAGRNKIKIPVLHVAGTAVFLFFITAMLTVAGVPNLLTFQTGPEMYAVNFQLFESWADFQGLYIANIIMFVPMGFLLPLLWANCSRLWKTVLFCFVFSLVIELMQLFNHRATDIDDLLMNTIGGAVGYAVYKAVYLIGGRAVRIFRIGAEEAAPMWIRCEAAILIFCILLLQFFAEPYMSVFSFSSI